MAGRRRSRRPIADGDEVARHVSYAKQLRDGDGNIHGILPAALLLRPDEEYVSVSWISFFAGERIERLRLALEGLRNTFRSGKMPARSLLAFANVGHLRSLGSGIGVRVRVTHEPTKVDPCHSGIRHQASDEQGLVELLAAEGFAARMEVSEIMAPPAA